ncbi:cytochrome P450 [Massariosphaeria phaeospora]|uniref:Cytochrome P450 n=1 Tax=Massariosphaeria phaeospora TaxID=100035 RepID=A0A7C8M1W9_9PLEO|nr:cytochrome P450 [Massariosphaeria phaeospora]
MRRGCDAVAFLEGTRCSNPQLPLGTSSTLRGLSETFSFHSSPESFITSRILSFQNEHPELIETRAVIRAKVLNRNIAVVSSHAQIQQVLTDDAAGYEASAAYDELMAPFFPSPNLLLTDGEKHGDMRRTWDVRMVALQERLKTLVRRQTEEHFSEPSTSEIDLYESMKTLSWKILLGAFLGLDSDGELFDKMESLQEDLLRGQFSLFPVSINTGFWHSPRSKGKEAKNKLQAEILSHLKGNKSACPFAITEEGALEDVAKHTVLMTSSLAVKALASLLTALLLNLYLYDNNQGKTLAESLASESDPDRRSRRLRSILLETERLSPPIVGVMRRSTKDNIISSPGNQADVIIPKGWDCWLYFVGGGRDPVAFGSTWDTFNPDRYMDKDIPQGIAFGGGSKTCLGLNPVRDIVLGVAETCLRMDIRMQGDVVARGVRGWLGWEPNNTIRPENWAQDMKQLPTQRPSEPVMVRVASGTR